MSSQDNTIALIGFGEAASAFVAGWGGARARHCRAFDIKTDSKRPGISESKYLDYEKSGVQGHGTLEAALRGSTRVFSLVTADQAGAAARSAAAFLEPGAFFLDCNSCSPGVKRNSARVINAAGGCYVDVAIMAPVHPGLHRTPLTISGPYAGSALELLGGLEMTATVAGTGVGDASSIKMIRSIVMKGLEALVADCVLAGRLAGVDEAVLATLEKTYPGFGWEQRAGYMLERMMTHGVRRAAEMGEVASTLEELGLGTALADATMERQQRIGELGLIAQSPDYRVLADQILESLTPAGEIGGGQNYSTIEQKE